MRKQVKFSFMEGVFLLSTSLMEKGLLLEYLTVAGPYVYVFYPYNLGGFCKGELLKLPKFQNGLQGKNGFNTPLLYGFILIITYLVDLQGF